MREMKDSGIEWIGEIPKGWKVPKIKYVAKFLNGDRGKNYPSGNDLTDSGIVFLTSNNIRGVVLDCTSDITKYITEKRYNILGGAKIRKNDIIFCLRGSVGNCAINKTENEGTIASSLVDIRPIKVVAGFLNYCLKSDINSIQTSINMNGSCAANLSAENVANYCFIEPSISEQQQIANFLDTQCSEIDATAEDIQKEISLLEEYKKSVITEAVTKGLNPDAEMKDSGIEWIGEIPKDWVTIRIGNIFSLRNERNYLPMEQVQLLSLYSGKGVFPTGEEGTTNSGNHAQTVADYKIVKRNDIVVNIILAWMGSLGISNYDGVVSPAYDVYIPDEEKVVPHYYHYVFRTSGIANECYRYGRGIMMMRWRTYSSEFKRIHVPFPSFDEQQQIADYLDSKCSEIDTLIADKKRQLDILADYKKSIIYEYVTGKKEVLVKDF